MSVRTGSRHPMPRSPADWTPAYYQALAAKLQQVRATQQAVAVPPVRKQVPHDPRPVQAQEQV